MIRSASPEFLMREIEALAAYRARRWEAAESELHACLELRRNDGPSIAFLERISWYRDRPPPADWDGSYLLEQSDGSRMSLHSRDSTVQRDFPLPSLTHHLMAAYTQ